MNVPKFSMLAQERFDLSHEICIPHTDEEYAILRCQYADTKLTPAEQNARPHRPIASDFSSEQLLETYLYERLEYDYIGCTDGIWDVLRMLERCDECVVPEPPKDLYDIEVWDEYAQTIKTCVAHYDEMRVLDDQFYELKMLDTVSSAIATVLENERIEEQIS